MDRPMKLLFFTSVLLLCSGCIELDAGSPQAPVVEPLFLPKHEPKKVDTDDSVLEETEAVINILYEEN